MKHDTGMFPKMLTALAIALGGRGEAALAACKLTRIVELPVILSDGHPKVTASINGTEASFIADSGAFYSMLSPAGAAEFKLKTYPAPWGLRVTGIGGQAASVWVTTVKEFTLAGVHIHNLEFLVGGSDVGGGGVGILGQNVFSIGDVEYDLAKGVIRLMREEDCRHTELAYWVTGTSQTYSLMTIEQTTRLSPHTTGSASINGVRIRVMFDTGAATSMLSLRAAERAGVKIDAPGVQEAGYSFGIGRGMIKTWIAPFASFKLGDEEIRNTRLRIGETLTDVDMLIGVDFFLSHRVYVASKQNKLFFTYNGGPVFNLALLPSSPPSPPSPPSTTDAPPLASPATGAAMNTPSPAASDEPMDAAAFSRRGSAYAARHDFDHAIADLTRACELAPDRPDYFYERGLARQQFRQLTLALADFGQALKLKPDHVPALVARAELQREMGYGPQAVEDLDAADRAAAKEADARLRMGFDYAHAGLLDQALVQFDLWIAAHAEDAQLGGALHGRCRAKALIGRDLAKALEDCSTALKLSARAKADSGHIFDSRGLVRLRLGDYDKAIADFDAALGLHSNDAWSLYGRGIAKLRRGKTAEGQVDIAAAKAASSEIVEEFRKHGLSP